MGVIKKKATASAQRSRKAQQGIRKKAKRKALRQRPSWKGALKKKLETETKRARPKPLNGDEGFEVQDEVNETLVARLNERDPMETQLFLTGVPVDADEKVVKAALDAISSVRRVMLVRNRITGAPTGAAFVHCGSKGVVSSIMDVAERNAREVSSATREDTKKQVVGLSHHAAKKTAHKLHQRVTTARDPFIEVQGIRVTVHFAVSRSDSHELAAVVKKKQRRTKVAKDDPRHLYLLREGLVESGSPAAKGLAPAYLAHLMRDYERRKEQVRNVNKFVSTTRLSIRHLPKTLGGDEVWTLVREQARMHLKAMPCDLDRSLFGKHGPVKHIKLMQDADGKSCGYAFVEFVSHNIALGVLRRLNNNPTVLGPHQRLIVTFAVEDVEAVQKQDRIREWRRARQQENAGRQGTTGAVGWEGSTTHARGAPCSEHS